MILNYKGNFYFYHENYCNLPRYFSEIKNLENNLNDKKYLVESFKPTGQGFNKK